MTRKSNTLKIVLIMLLFGSAFFDIYHTISDKNFLLLESNFIFFSVGIEILIAIKLGFMVFLSLMVYYPSKLSKGDFVKFFYVHLIMLLIFAQLFAGINNAAIKEAITNTVNEVEGTTYEPGDVPSETIKDNYMATPKAAVKHYIKFMGLIFYIPFFLALISFKLWYVIREEEMIEELLKEAVPIE